MLTSLCSHSKLKIEFGLNVAPQIMRSIIKAMVGQDEFVNSATSTYIGNIFINKGICPAACVKEHLRQFD